MTGTARGLEKDIEAASLGLGIKRTRYNAYAQTRNVPFTPGRGKESKLSDKEKLKMPDSLRIET
jgi:hypothetical protein